MVHSSPLPTPGPRGRVRRWPDAIHDRMRKGPPKRVAIDHDDYHAEYVGTTRRGHQFFLTTPFVPAYAGAEGREFIALYVFDAKGALLDATIDDLGPRAKLDADARVRRRDELLGSLGPVKFRRITIAPFSLERHGVTFGLIPRAPDEDGQDWCAIFMPGDVMCFWPPWTSGVYDT